METSKYGVWGLWLGSIAAISFGDGWVVTAGHMALWGTLAVHVIEFLAVRSTLEQAGGSMANHFVQTVIYGLFHWLPIKKRLAAGGSG